MKEALPESLMIFLIRDLRDVFSFALDGAQKRNWLKERRDAGSRTREVLPDKRVSSTPRIPIDDGELARVVAKNCRENVSEEEKGRRGRFYRRAAHEGWQEDLTAQQVRQVESVTASLLGEFCSGDEP